MYKGDQLQTRLKTNFTWKYSVLARQYWLYTWIFRALYVSLPEILYVTAILYKCGEYAEMNAQIKTANGKCHSEVKSPNPGCSVWQVAQNWIPK